MKNDFPRSGKNIGGYFGERIDMAGLLNAMVRQAGERGWIVDELPTTDGLTLTALRRPGKMGGKNIYISAGIHGDEPAGPLAAMDLLRQERWSDASVWLCPCLNPAGFLRGTRENAGGIDLNRDYRDTISAEIRAHKEWLARQPSFDFALCLHEDWESHGFYLYERNRRGRESALAPRIVEAVAKVCPVDESPEIEGWKAERGVIAIDDDLESRPLWPESLFLTATKTAQSCTLEAPSDYALSVRVAALVAAVHAAVE